MQVIDIDFISDLNRQNKKISVTAAKKSKDAWRDTKDFGFLSGKKVTGLLSWLWEHSEWITFLTRLLEILWDVSEFLRLLMSPSRASLTLKFFFLRYEIEKGLRAVCVTCSPWSPACTSPLSPSCLSSWHSALFSSVVIGACLSGTMKLAKSDPTLRGTKMANKQNKRRNHVF